MEREYFEIQAAKNFFFGVEEDDAALYMLNRLIIISEKNPTLNDHIDIHTWDRHNYIPFETLLKDIMDLADQFELMYNKGLNINN